MLPNITPRNGFTREQALMAIGRTEGVRADV